MGEERGPFKGGGAVGVGAANKLVLVAAPLAIIPTDEFCLTELANEVAAVAAPLAIE